MKKILTIICGLGLLAGGCGDFLDIVPDNDIKSIETIFEQRSQVDQWVATCYRNMSNNASLVSNAAYTGADELVGNDRLRYSMGVNGNMEGLLIGDGVQSALSPISGSWTSTSYYATIRYCNTFFEHIDDAFNIKEDERNLWTAEVKAVKAFYYFQLVRKYGPIVLLDNTVGVETETEDMKMPRSHVDTCFNEIVRLLDEAIPVLPLKAEKETERQGYFYKESAMALKAVVLVYQASPLFNGNPYMANFRNRAGEPLFSAEEDREKWRVAAEACDAAIELCESAGWGLVGGDAAADIPLRERLQYIDESVLAPGCQSEEVVLMAKRPNSAMVADLFFYGHTLPYLTHSGTRPNSSSSDGSLAPSLNIIDMYYTENGLPMENDLTWIETKPNAAQMMGSVDDPLYYDKVIPANERVLESHLDREPRFYANIAFDRGYWRGIIKSTDEEDNPLVVMARRGETFGTYLTDLQSDGYQNRTGYWLLKHLYLDVPCDGYSTQVDSKGALPMPLIRMAQLYLMSSEAWNEYLDAPNEDVYAGIDKVRSRAGIPDVRTAWTRYSNQPDKPTSKVGMRDIIRRETTIELAFEGQRFWDLRRWLIAHEVLNEPLYGWNVVATEESGFYNNFQGPIVVWSLRGFTAPRDYFWPISSSEVMRSGVVQNPGW